VGQPSRESGKPSRSVSASGVINDGGGGSCGGSGWVSSSESSAPISSMRASALESGALGCTICTKRIVGASASLSSSATP
jgi:hypothetical protein